MELKIRVPDTDSCQRCDFLSADYYENAMRQAVTTYTCGIFKCQIENFKKCTACKICGKGGVE